MKQDSVLPPYPYWQSFFPRQLIYYNIVRLRRQITIVITTLKNEMQKSTRMRFASPRRSRKHANTRVDLGTLLCRHSKILFGTSEKFEKRTFRPCGLKIFYQKIRRKYFLLNTRCHKCFPWKNRCFEYKCFPCLGSRKLKVLSTQLYECKVQ